MSYISHKTEILQRFECQGSGNCCRAVGHVYVTDQNIREMAVILNMLPFQFIQQFVIKENGWVLIAHGSFRPDCFLDPQNRCQVYEARPAACRSYPDWPSIWASDQALLKEADACPGLKKALATCCDSL